MERKGLMLMVVVVVVSLLPSYSCTNTASNTTAILTRLPTTADPKEYQMIIRGKEDITLLDQSELQFCLESIISDHMPSEFQSTATHACYTIRKENEAGLWKVGRAIKPPAPCYAMVDEDFLQDMNGILGALGGIISVLIVLVIATLISYLHSLGFFIRLCGDRKNFVMKSKVTDETGTETPIVPQRPSHTLGENNHTGASPQSQATRDSSNSISRESYIHPNKIKYWCVKELEKKKALDGNIVVQE